MQINNDSFIVIESKQEYEDFVYDLMEKLEKELEFIKTQKPMQYMYTCEILCGYYKCLDRYIKCEKTKISIGESVYYYIDNMLDCMDENMMLVDNIRMYNLIVKLSHEFMHKYIYENGIVKCKCIKCGENISVNIGDNYVNVCKFCVLFGDKI